MILLVDLSFRKNSLSRDEFVGPVARIVKSAERDNQCLHFSDIPKKGPDDSFTGIILCGTALKDNGFLEKAGAFSWLEDIPAPILGICAGMQALCLVFGGNVSPGCEIGMTGIRVTAPNQILPDGPEFRAYELHSFSCDPPPGWEVLAVSDTCVQAIRHPEKPLFGVMFHPEVRNDIVVERFLSMCGE